MIKYKLIASGYKDYVRLMLGDTEIVYIKTTKENFDLIEQELRFMVDALNVLPTLIGGLQSVMGIEAWITPQERHLTSKVYSALAEYEKTSLAKYNHHYERTTT